MRFSFEQAIPLCCLVLLCVPWAVGADADLRHPEETHLEDIRQLTFGGENAEAYWSPDGESLIFQSMRPPFGCDQIFRMPADGSGETELLSTGKGRTTCAYFTYPRGERILYASTHETDEACPPPPDRSQGYVWPIYPGYEIYSALPHGSDLRRLTKNDAYDAEATVCPLDGTVIFTSTRDGDLDLYRMKPDGSDVVRLTDAPGYDGGAFFSADCTKIVWRASRPEGEALEDYRRLLEQGLVRPSKMEIWVADADGSDARQLTYFEKGSFAPFFTPDGRRILFSSNFGSGSAREFDIWAINVDGTSLERITYAEGFDGFPMFSPDGSRLAFSSNRNQGKPGETDVYVATWVESPERGARPYVGAAGRYLADVAWLADDAREGRGIGTEGLHAAAAWLEERFAEWGVRPAGNPIETGEVGYRHTFPVPVEVVVEEGTGVKLDGTSLSLLENGNGDFVPAAFSASGEASGPVVAVGYGITSEELEWDDYAGLDVEGKIVVVRRFTPSEGKFEDEEAQRRYSDLRYKAFNARQHGAAALLVVDLPPPEAGETSASDEAPLPPLRVDAKGDAGIPVAFLSRAAGEVLFGEGAHRLEIAVQLMVRYDPKANANVVGKFPAAAPEEERLPGAVLVGAHYDHLGYGGRGSLSPDRREPHNGADDNASGTAGLLEVARRLGERRNELRRDVYLVAFSAEESGLLGSSALVQSPPPGLAIEDLVAMLNMDMIGRLRDNQVSILGAESAAEWKELVQPLCDSLRVRCSPSGDGYGPSDQTPFYAAGVPVLHFFTGAHEDYHKPSDDTLGINAVGGARVARLVADTAIAAAAREGLTYQEVPAPVPQGDRRSFGAYLGTIPDYADDGEGGVALAGVRKGSPAERAGFQRGDRLVGLKGTKIGDIYDFVFVLRGAKPGEETTAVVLRHGERVELRVVFGKRGE